MKIKNTQSQNYISKRRDILNHLLPIGILIVTIFILNSCTESKEVIKKQVVSKTTLPNIRLADGMPLDITISTRWEIQNNEKFNLQFQSTSNYDSLILFPRQQELANNVSNLYTNVDSVFTIQRHEFITDMKDYINKNLKEEGIIINEVIISDVNFPETYTNAKETLALQEQELKRIRKQSVIDLENAEARKKQTSAKGEVDIAQAKTNAKVEKINAETEKIRRKSELARAETQKQVDEKRAESDARRKVLLAKADLEKKRDLKNLDIQRKRDENKVALEHENNLEELVIQKEMKQAKLYNENPIYAKYKINKELASKVKIAVLPSGENANVFNGFLNNQISD